MSELLATLAPILIVDLLNPVLFALLVFAAGSGRPVANSSALLLGHTLVYFIAGIAISFGIEQAAYRLANPHRIDFVLSGIIGAGLIWMAVRMNTVGAPTGNQPEGELTPATCLGIGAVVKFVGIPFALPYFAAVDQIMKANMPLAESVYALAIYNGLYALPFATVPIAVGVFGDSARPMLQLISRYLERAAQAAMPWLLGLLGLALLIDAFAYFYRGQGLIKF